MDDFLEGTAVEKSCWSVTAWALIAALVLGIAGTAVIGKHQGEAVASTAVSSN